jgi:uncharacterized protein
MATWRQALEVVMTQEDVARLAARSFRQLRRFHHLINSNKVFGTHTGARKLAHYVERGMTRLLAVRSAPIALPAEPATPDANALPGQPAPRPLTGPILPLVAPSVDEDQLLGGPGARPVTIDALAARVLFKGEPLSAPAGRADDFAWPRREIEREQSKGETPVAAALPETLRDSNATMMVPAASLKPKKHRR